MKKGKRKGGTEGGEKVKKERNNKNCWTKLDLLFLGNKE